MRKTPQTSKKAMRDELAKIDSLLATTKPNTPLHTQLTTMRKHVEFRLSL